MKSISLVLVFLVATTGVGVYSWNDAVINMAPDGQGARLASDLVRIFFRTKLRPDANTKKVWEEITSRFHVLNPNTLYDSDLIKDLDDGFRGLGFAGRMGPDRCYDICQSHRNYNADLPPGLGAFRTLLGLKKIETSMLGGRSFSGFFKLKLRSGELSNQNLFALGDGVQKIISPTNLEALQPLKTRKKSHANQEAFIVLMELYDKFPRSTLPMKRYINVTQSVLKRDEYKGTEYTRSIARASFRLKEIKRDYPGLSEYLDHLKNLFALKLAVKNKEGNNLAILETSTKESFFTLTTMTREGKVVPFTDKLKPVFDQEFSMTDVSDYELTLDSSLLVDVYGLKFKSDRIRSKVHYKSEPGKAWFDFKLESVKKIKVKGKFVKVLPDWLIDMAIPTNMEELANNFVKLMINANKGQGSLLHMEWDTTNPKDVVFHMSGSTEIVDSFFVRFAGAVVRYAFQTTGETRTELKNLMDLTVSGLISDLNMYVEPEKKADGV